MHGRKIPAGTTVPEVIHVKVYQMARNMREFLKRITRWLDMNVLIVFD